MKKITARSAMMRLGVMIMVAFCLSLDSWGQTTIFSDNFESYSANHGLYTSGTSQWLLSLQSGSTSSDQWAIGTGSGALQGNYGLTICNKYTPWWGGSSTYTYASYDKNTSTNQIAYYSEKIDASNYVALTLSFKWECQGEISNNHKVDYDYGTVVYSLDGSNWNDLSNDYLNQSTGLNASVSLPAALNRQKFYIGFRWQCDNSGGSDQPFTVDNVAITGTPLIKYYSFGNSSITNDVNSWWTNTNGTGTHPANFTAVNQQFIVQSGSTITSSGTWTVSGSNSAIEVKSGGTLNCSSGANVTGTASFTLDAGGTLGIGNASGITSSGTSGNIQVTGTRTYDPAANYNYIGTAAQVTGNGLPSAVNNLTVNNAAGVTLSQDLTVSNLLTLQSGNFSVAGNTLTLNGPAIQGTATNLATSSSSSLVFGGSSSNISVPSSITSLNNLTVNNANGIKLNSNLTIGGTLNLTNGIIDATSYLITVNNSAVSAISGGSSSSFINNGSLARKLAANIAVNGSTYSYPIGENGNFKELDLVNVRTGSTGPVVQAQVATFGGNMNADGTTITGMNSRTWNVQLLSGNFTSSYIQLTEGGLNYNNTVGKSSAQSGTYSSIGGTVSGSTIVSTQAVTSFPDYFAIGASVVKTLYSYQNGDWDNASSWTLDPSGTFYVNGGTPTSADNAVILNGRTITVNANTRQSKTLEIREGGILDLKTYTGHNFGTVSGQGKLVLASTTFPGGDYTSFTNAGGGTVEYQNAVAFSLSQFRYNNLIFNTNGSQTGTVANNLVVNGNLTIANGTFQIGDSYATQRIDTIYGNVTVSSTGKITLGTGNVNHRFIVKGDFTNNGSAVFTEYDAPDYQGNYIYYYPYATADLVFNNTTKNQSLQCNGKSDFYRIEIDKGIDQTYILNIDADNSSHFNLYGENDLQTSPPTTGSPNIPNENALGLLAGTVRLGPNIILPSLADNAVYNIDLDAKLWLDGAKVTLSSVTSNSSLIIYGNLKLSNNAVLTANGIQGIVMREQSAFQMESGTVTTPCLRTSAISGVHRGALTMSGGIINITGNNANTYGLEGLKAYASFTMPYPDNVFSMSGGVINITSPTTYWNSNPPPGGTGTYFSLLLGMKSDNINVTGGKINITIPNGNNAYINSTAPFWDLQINGSNTARSLMVQNYGGYGSPSLPVIAPQPLIVKDSLLIQNNAVLNTSVTSGNPAYADVTVGGNFIIRPGAVYTPGTNTTIFNGTSAQQFDNSGTITSGLNNLTITNSTITTLLSNDLTVRGLLEVDNGAKFDDNGKYVYVNGNILNSGILAGQLTGGGVRLNGTTAQTIGGNGKGIFNNLILDKSNTTGVTLTADQSLTGNLRLANTNGNLNIGSIKLSLSEVSNIYTNVTSTAQVYDNSHMIISSGLQSDGGVSKAFNDMNKSFIYPLGFGTAYHPASILFNNSPSQWGSVTIRSVSVVHPLVQGTNQAIKYYWKTTSDGFTDGIPAGITQKYFYQPADAPVASDEANYIPAAYISPVWKTDFGTSAVLDNLTPREIDFTNVNYLDGEYTAGLAAAFNGLKVYYSRDLAPNITTTGADWNDKNTWSLTSHSDASGLSANLTNDQGHAVFIIGDGTSSHKVNISQNIIKSGNLVINTNSTLDIGTTTGHSFGSLPDSKIAGKGTLRIASTGYFPSADWGDFLGQTGGTVEYYTTSATNLNMPTQYTLPSGATMNINSYYNLKSSPYSGSNIIFPNQSLTVYGDFTIGSTSGGINCVTQLNPGASSKTLDLKGKLNINQYGILRYMNAAAQNVVAEGDIAIANGGTFDVTTSGTASLNNTLTVSGNLTNNGTFDMNPATNRYCNLTFTGSNNKVVDGTTASRTRFYTINVNKGSSRDTIIDVKVNSTNFALNGPTPALTLTNGTFRLTTPVDITLTTGTFNIPITGCLSANGGTMRMATAAAGNDLTLDGRVEVLNGAIYVGDSTKVQNNDIEYSSGGTPEIRVSGGRLFVNGQVRRVTTINTGSLNYFQSGGSVFIAGQNANNARAMFEVLNSDSKFEMSGGTLVLANNFNDANYQDLYLTPESSSVTGGTIQFGSLNTTPAVSQFNIVASSPLWNVTVDGYNTPVVNLQVYSLVVNNDLLINGNSVFNANGLDVSIGHNLTNNNTGGTPAGISSGGYQPGSLTQNTTFNGTSSQVISGAGSNLTNFANLIVATSGTLSLNANSAVQVNGNLTLKSGILSDGANAINVLGNIENDAIHQSSDINGGIRLISNSGRQVVSGNGSGTFGNVELVNNNGINMIDNSVINGQLKFTSGSLYIDDYLLTLGASSSVIGYNSNRMILLNGALSDEGVKKIFSAGTNSFTYPIGISGKFSPVTYDVNSASTTGFITVKPVNSAHPAETDAIGDELAYYWSVKASGLSGAKFNHKYQYVSNDVKGTESSYVGGRYSYYKWYSPVGTVDVSGHALNIGASDSIAGEYTVGDPLNFQSKPVLYSRNERSTNKWTVDDTWSTEGPAGASCNCHPDGNPVIIAEGHTIVLDANSAKAFSVDIKGTLDAGTTTFHNLGHVLSSGTGTLRLTPTTAGMYVFPGGEFDDFMEKTGTTVEFYGSTNGTLPLKPGNYYKPYQNVHFTNTAISYMSAENLRALGNLTIENGCKLNNTLYNKDLSLLGNWTDNNTSTGGFNAGTGTVSADGNADQTFTMASGVTEYFYNYTMNNSSTGVTLSNGNITVNNQLNLNSGNMTTNITNTGSNQNFTVNNSSTTAVTGGSSASFVNGFLRKKISNGSSFGFPVGDATTRQRYGAVSVLSTSTSGDQIWAARYADKNPTTDSYDINQVVDPLAKPVSDNEYWNVVGPTSGSANIRLRWDQYSGAGSDASARQKFMVAEWASPVSGAWNAAGKLVNDGGQISGTVETTTPVGLDNHIFTLGTSSLPTARISSTSPSPLTICNDGTLASLVISFTDVSNSPFGFKYSINGVEQPAVTNVSSPYTLTFSGTTLGALANMTSPATYTVKLIDVWDKTNTHGYIRTPVSAVITVNPVPTNTITGRTSAGTGESDTYSTPADGASYSWTLDVTNMGTSTSFSTTWGSAGTHTVALTKTNSYGCSVTNSISVVVTTTPSPVISGNNYVCSGSSQTYSTTNFSGHTYTWTVTGGTISSGSGTSSITVSWPNSAGTGTVNLKECNGSNCKDATSMSVSIGQSPSDRTIGPLTQNVCEGNKAEIMVTNSESFVTYQIQAAGINSGSAVSGNGSSIVLNTDVLKPGDAPSYTVHAYTEAPYNCAIDLTGTANVTINPLPVAAGLISGSDAVCQGQSGIIYTLPAVNYATAYNWVLPSGITITSGATTNSITVNIAGTASPGTLILQVNGTNSCGSGSASNYNVTISLTPVTGPVYREPNN